MAVVAVGVRATIAVHFEGEAMHRVAAAAETLQVAIVLLDDLADLSAAFLGSERHKTIHGERVIQAAIGEVAGEQTFFGEID